ncbi:ovostatin-like isoform X2 [Pseudophryne corroboree]|uniref:ovostatin-like isoform X2 n=1 Tax=Pseudophryne corroboree TaxID=495146 RepID=UPI003082071B
MDLRMLLLNLSLLYLIAGAASETQFAFYIPCRLQSEQTGRGCLDVRHQTAPINVDAFLEVNGDNYTIINEEIPVAFTFKCYDFPVPLVSEAVPAFITIKATSGDFNYIERRAVVVAPNVNVTFIQMNKYMFKPGDTVRCYVFTLQNNLKPVEETYPTIYVQDSAGNRMFQWDNRKTENGFLKLEIPLLDDQEPGQYTVTVEGANSGTSSETLMVEEYVLPKMSVDIDAPSSITILDKRMPYKATAKYTYGQGVPGKVTVRVCRAPINYYLGNTCNRNPDGICSYNTGDLDSNGTFNGDLDLTPFQLDRSGNQMSLTMQLTVTEEGTGVKTTESKYISIVSQLATASFNRNLMSPYYKQGLPYHVEILVKDSVGRPLAYQVVELQLNGLTLKNLTTDGNGTAQYDLETSNLTDSTINIQVIYKNPEQCYDSNWIVPSYANDYFSITRFYSRTNSIIQIQSLKEDLQCGQTYEINIQYSFGKDWLKEGETTANFIHMVISRSKILITGEHPIDVTAALKGEFTISLEVNSDLAPDAQLIVYYVSTQELVADTAHLSIEKCFNNQVSVAFSEEKGTPGSDVTLGITAASESICATRIRDASLLLMEQGNPITPDSVYSSYQYNAENYYTNGYNVEPAQPPCIDPNQRVMINGIYFIPTDSPGEGDVYQLLKALCIHFIGPNITISKPVLCGSSRVPVPIFPFHEASFAKVGADGGADVGVNVGAVTPVPAIVSERTYFPEVWYYDLARVGESGSTSVPLQVPGTITEWKADMICLSNQSGIGMTKHPANYTSFQLFFVDVTLPYSIVRGEILSLRAFASNYLDKCAKVRVTLHPSDDYTAEAGNEESVQCICSGQRASYSWQVNATSLGVLNISVTGETIQIGDSCDGPADSTQPLRKDTIVRSLIVQAEGIQKEVTRSDFICVNDTSVVIPIGVFTPENTVKDSAKASVTVFGDIFGRALTNPESVNREPTGCGEQTIASLMPIPIAVDYLNKTGRLTEDYEKRAIENMAIGYRRILNFRNSDGSFSAFAGGRTKPSTWLTFRVLETLQRVVQYTFVDRTILNQGLVYLESLQDLTTGCFEPKGMVFNNDLKGGAEGKVSFTSVMIVLLSETYKLARTTLVRNALDCLVAASKQEDQRIYNRVMMFHAFRVTGDVARSNAMLQILKSQAIVEGGTVHLELPIQPKQQPFYVFAPQASSADIEMTARFLLGLAVGSDHTPEEISYMSTVALWLSRQQTSSGSYSSTPDTVEVLKALSDFAPLVYQKITNNAVLVQYGDEVIRQFNLDANNRLLIQTQPLSSIPGNYSINISGRGCVLLQTTVQYNIPVSQEDAAFWLSVSTPSVNCVNGVAYKIPVVLNVSYHGSGNESNMALLKMPLLSGYQLDQSSLNQPGNKVSKFEVKNNDVILYFEKVTHKILNVALDLELMDQVSNLQPKTVTLWDYYNKGENAAAVLRPPCSN